MFRVKLVDFLTPTTGEQCWFSTSYQHDITRVFSGILDDGDVDICMESAAATRLADAMDRTITSEGGGETDRGARHEVRYEEATSGLAAFVRIVFAGGTLTLIFSDMTDPADEWESTVDIKMGIPAARESVDALRKAIIAATGARDPVAETVALLPPRLQPAAWTRIREPLWPPEAAVEVVELFARAGLVVGPVISLTLEAGQWEREIVSQYDVAGEGDRQEYVARAARLAQEWIRDVGAQSGEMIQLYWGDKDASQEWVRVRGDVVERFS